MSGLANIPHGTQYTIVANHQGNFDIPAMIRTFPVPIAFVTKIELKKIPILRQWLRVLHCPVIDRSNSPLARQIIASYLENSPPYPLLIFPEGTRSQSGKAGHFRSGGLETIKRSGITVVPVSISGSFKAWEEHKQIRSATIHISIHPPLKPEDYQALESDAFLALIRKTISSALP